MASTATTSTSSEPTSTLPSPESLLTFSLSRSRALFSSTPLNSSILSSNDSSSICQEAVKARLSSKINHEYGHAKILPTALANQQAANTKAGDRKRKVDDDPQGNGGIERDIIQKLDRGSAQVKAAG